MWANIVIKRHSVHGVVHNCFFQVPILPCTYESGPANFDQGLLPHGLSTITTIPRPRSGMAPDETEGHTLEKWQGNGKADLFFNFFY
jgi:hypothetical protein